MGENSIMSYFDACAVQLPVARVAGIVSRLNPSQDVTVKWEGTYTVVDL